MKWTKLGNSAYRSDSWYLFRREARWVLTHDSKRIGVYDTLWVAMSVADVVEQAAA